MVPVNANDRGSTRPSTEVDTVASEKQATWRGERAWRSLREYSIAIAAGLVTISGVIATESVAPLGSTMDASCQRQPEATIG